MADDLLITNLTGDGTWQSHAVPAGVLSIAIQATGGDVPMALDDDDSDPQWTLHEASPLPFNVRSMAGKTLWFKGAVGTTVQIISLTGLG